MSLRGFETFSDREAGLLNALQLAYLGDAVWETIVRGILLHRRMNVNHMHVHCVEYVNAHAQASFLDQLDSMLNPDEAEIVRRGRNAHARHPSPRNQRPEEYAAATGFEALIGYLYLTGKEERIGEFASMIIGGE